MTDSSSLHPVEAAYWQRLLHRRIDRRRALFAAASTAAGLGLLACTGPDDPRSAAADTRLLSLPFDTTASARAGGTFKSFITGDGGGFDPLASASLLALTQVAAYTYPRLFKFTTIPFPGVATGAVEGDLAESYELSGDKLTLTLKLRQNLKWDTKAPVNGRIIDAQDVVFSWNKYARVNPNRYELAYHQDLGPGAPIESVSAPDARTVVFKLKQANAAILQMLAFERGLYVMPRESDGGFDPARDIRGYGPWLIAENRTGFRAWNRNPDYHVKGRPYPEKLEQIIAPEYAARLAQFKSGLIWQSVVSQEDLLPTKREMPQLLLRQAETFSTAPSSLAFGWDSLSPWRDERLRQSVSLLIDREALVDLRTNREALQNEGLPFNVRYHTAIAAGWDGYWVDPLDRGLFGSAAEFFEYEPSRARQLLVAGGYADGLETALHYAGGNDYSASYTRTAELISGMLQAGGVSAKLDPLDMQSEWLPHYYNGYNTTANVGKTIRGYPGVIYRPMPAYSSFQAQIFASLHRGGTRFIGVTPDGRDPTAGDPDVNKAIEEIRSEFDDTKLKARALDYARLMARKAYDIPMLPYSTLGFGLFWPVIGNLGVNRGWPAGNPVTESNLHLWIDQTKQPIAPATNN